MSTGTAAPHLEEHSFERLPLKRVGTTSGRIGWQNLRSDEFTTEGPYLVTGMHFNNRGGVDWERCFHITADRWVMAPEIQLRPQDILFTKDGSIGKVAFVDDLPGPAALNSHLLVIRPRRSAFVPRFLFHVLNSQLLSDFVEIEKRGTTFSGITEESVDQFPVPLPPPPTQRVIANYLDVETTRIDALIEKKRRLIELANERRIAGVRQMVRDSAGPLTRLRRLCRIKRGASPRPIGDERYFDAEGSHGWVRIADVSRAGMYLTTTSQRLSEVGKRLSVPVGRGVVLVSISASVGKPVITDMNCCYHDGFVGLLALRALPEYVYYALLLPETFAGLGQLGTQENINSDILGDTAIPLPDRLTQERVVAKLVKEDAKFDALRWCLQRHIELLEERRRALITAAVTGDFDLTVGTT